MLDKGMAKENEYPIADGALKYQRTDDGAEITGCTGLLGEITVPRSIEGLPVTGIGRKAFLSRKAIRRVELPETVRRIGDWAFAYCDGLQEVVFGSREVLFGRSVFLECGRLRELTVPGPQREDEKAGGGKPGPGPEGGGAGSGKPEPRPEGGEAGIGNLEPWQEGGGTGIGKPEPWPEGGGTGIGKAPGEGAGTAQKTKKGTGALLAAAVTRMDAAYLLDFQEAGSREWLEKWDSRLMAVLHTPDAEGYSRQILCGEEDYGSTDLEAYLSDRRKSKIRLIFIRLLNPEGLSEENRREVQEYLLRHTKGCGSEETWQVVWKECGNLRACYELFAETGCFRKENAAEVIADIGEDAPEMKAFFLRYQAQHFGADDFFGGLEL